MGMNNEDQLWYKTWQLYRVAAQNPKINDAKREVFSHLAEDVKQQIEKIEKRTAKNPILERISTRNFILLSIIILAVSLSISYIYLHQHSLSGNVTKSHTTSKKYGLKKFNRGQFSSRIKSANRTSVIEDYRLIIYARNNVLWMTSLCFLLLIFCSIIWNGFLIRKICGLYRMISMSWNNRASSRLNKIEKVVLLDPMRQHSHYRELFIDDLLVHTSIDECFYELSSKSLNDYVLFLSSANFQIHSAKLSRLSHVSFGIFYDDNDPSNLQISKRKYRIRFDPFPESFLDEYLGHAIRLNYIQQAHIYDRQGVEHEAEKSLLYTSQHHLNLSHYFEQQSGTRNGTPPDEIHHEIIKQPFPILED